jgi:hydrogenase maturation protease
MCHAFPHADAGKGIGIVTVRIIGVGQRWAGDDGVGPAVIGRIRKLDCGFELIEIDEPTQLVELLTGGADPVVLVDAVLAGAPAGRVVVIDSLKPDPHARHLLSTHGIGVMEAIGLARIAYPERVARRIFIVGVTIEETSRRGNNLSPPVEAALPHAVAEVIKIAAAG